MYFSADGRIYPRLGDECLAKSIQIRYSKYVDHFQPEGDGGGEWSGGRHPGFGKVMRCNEDYVYNHNVVHMRKLHTGERSTRIYTLNRDFWKFISQRKYAQNLYNFGYSFSSLLYTRKETMKILVQVKAFKL